MQEVIQFILYTGTNEQSEQGQVPPLTPAEVSIGGALRMSK